MKRTRRLSFKSHPILY